ncbi:MAG: hypothetical protein AAFX94_14940, partial [Myxococcota bacterium]
TSTAIPPRSKWDSVLASFGLSAEWVPVAELPAELRTAIHLHAESPDGGQQELNLESLGTLARLRQPLPELTFTEGFRVEEDVAWVDRYALLRALVVEPGAGPTPVSSDSAESKVRTTVGSERIGAATADLASPDSATSTAHPSGTADSGNFTGGDGRQEHQADDTPSEDEEALAPVTIRGGDAFELIPDAPSDLKTALKQIQLGDSESVRHASSALLGSGASDETVHLSTHYSVSVPEVEALLVGIRDDAEEAGADRLAFRAEETMDALYAILDTDQFIDQINSASIPIEQLLMMVMIHVAESSDVELRNKMEEVMLAEQEEAQRAAREGMVEIGSAIVNTDIPTTIFDEADQDLATGTKSSAVLMQELQHLTHQWQQTNELISNLSKSLHDMAMTPIRNLR